jgi:hypothetical protein
MGRVVRARDYPAADGRFEIDLTGVAAGHYFLRVEQGERRRGSARVAVLP